MVSVFFKLHHLLQNLPNAVSWKDNQVWTLRFKMKGQQGFVGDSFPQAFLWLKKKCIVSHSNFNGIMKFQLLCNYQNIQIVRFGEATTNMVYNICTMFLQQLDVHSKQIFRQSKINKF